MFGNTLLHRHAIKYQHTILQTLSADPDKPTTVSLWSRYW